ncbi:MAG TPA: prephenate dehydrogenase/arogenate dehydrogenase family protein [Polyangiaceae bacterium]
MNALVIGLGLIGGSFALALRDLEPATRVTGVDLRAVLDRALARGAVDHAIELDDTAAIERACADADLVFLSAPVVAIRAMLPGVLARARVVTDCGSTKRAIVEHARSSARFGRFVPGHPMAGAPDGGIDLADANLFRGRRWLLCPEGSDADAASFVETLVTRLGATPLRIGIDDHDRAVALTSHVVQVVTSALAAVAEESGAELAAGPAFERATRGAGGPEEIWGDILSTNADAVAAGIAAVTRELSLVEAGLRLPKPDTGPARALLARARRLRKG